MKPILAILLALVSLCRAADVTLAWDSVDGATGYELSIAGGGETREVSAVEPQATVALQGPRDYQATVRAVSNEWTTGPSDPAVFGVVVLTLQWSPALELPTWTDVTTFERVVTGPQGYYRMSIAAP